MSKRKAIVSVVLAAVAAGLGVIAKLFATNTTAKKTTEE